MLYEVITTTTRTPRTPTPENSSFLAMAAMLACLFSADLTAAVTQACVVTLAPVTTRIGESVLV